MHSEAAPWLLELTGRLGERRDWSIEDGTEFSHR